MEIRQILAPTDFSEFSRQAIDNAFALAQIFGAKLLRICRKFVFVSFFDAVSC